MNILTNVEHLKNLLRSLNLKPKDYLGQNFLVSGEALEEIIAAAQIKKSDTVVEIGPGFGVLTRELAARAGRVIAVEKDAKLAAVIKRYFQNESKLEVIEQDALRFNFSGLNSYKVVANIPYYLTSHLIQILLTSERKPARIVLMVQKEVGERLIAEAGEYSILGISVQIFAEAHIQAYVPRQNFWPVPKVDSCIVVIEPKNKSRQIKDQKLFFRILKIAFAGKRKQIHNTLINGLKISKEQILEILRTAKIDPAARPQELSIEQWVSLYQEIEKRGI